MSKLEVFLAETLRLFIWAIIFGLIVILLFFYPKGALHWVKFAMEGGVFYLAVPLLSVIAILFLIGLMYWAQKEISAELKASTR